MSLDILAELDAILEESMERHPPEPPALPPPPPIRTVPRTGTLVQRSDHQTKAKWQALITPPPPLPGRKPTSAICAVQAVVPPATTGAPKPHRRRRKAVIRPAPPTLIPAAQAAPLPPFGPEPPPPILVEYAPGRTTAVPYFAATKSRVYKLRTPEGRWKLRFNRAGELTSSQEMAVAHASLP